MQANGQKIVVLGTGGTIAGVAASAQDTLGYAAAQLGIGEILAAIAPLQNLEITSEQVAQVDSKDMSLGIWRTLAARCAYWLAQDDVQGLVITHGTDTLEETAFLLQSVLAPAKPVVMTCAMRPATALMPDGPQNLVDAVTVASQAGACGVVVVCAGVIHGAQDVAKVHAHRLDAFSSGDAGPVGYVESQRLRLVRGWPSSSQPAARIAFDALVSATQWPRVEIVLNYAGATGAWVDMLCAGGANGIVAAGTGNGTLSASLEAALLKARASGVTVVRASRCADGVVLSTGSDLLPGSNGLSAVKARVALLLDLLSA